MIILKILFIAMLIYISIYDIKYYLIKNNLILLLFLVGIVKNILLKNIYISNISGFLSAFSIFFFLFLFFPKGIGFGDVKLAGAIGLFLGFKLTILAILLAFFSGAIIGLLLIALGKKTMKDPIPFGPFLAFGAITSLFLGEYIIDWYLKLFI